MKKIILAIALVTCLTMAGYSGIAKSALSVDFGPTIQWALMNPATFGIGAGYEWNFIIPNLSLALNVAYASYSYTYGSDSISLTFLPVGLFLRVYPITQSVSGLWIGAGYTYIIAIASVTIGGSTMSLPAALGSYIPIDVGYKWIVTGDMGLFVEPYVGYKLYLAGDTSSLGSVPSTPVTGFDYGIRAGLAF
jgi:hypothetical protein